MSINKISLGLSILLIIKSISFLSIWICLSEKLFSIIANISSSSGESIFAKRQFFDLEVKSGSLCLISFIGFVEFDVDRKLHNKPGYGESILQMAETATHDFLDKNQIIKIIIYLYILTNYYKNTHSLWETIAIASAGSSGQNRPTRKSIQRHF